MWAQAAVVICSILQISYAVTGYVTVNDREVLMSEVSADIPTTKDFNSLGHYRFYEGERVRIACSKDTTASDTSELIYGKGDQRYECKKPTNEGTDVSPSLFVTLTDASHHAYAECAVPGAAGALRSRVYFIRQNLPLEGGLYFRVNGVPLVPVPGRDETERRAHHALEYGYYAGEQLEVVSYQDQETYGPMECVLRGEDLPTELSGMKSPFVTDNVHFVANLQKQRASLDCKVAVKSADAQSQKNIYISLALKPFGEYLRVDEFPQSCRIPEFFLKYIDIVTVSGAATAEARANAIRTAEATSLASATVSAAATSIATSAITAAAVSQATATGTAITEATATGEIRATARSLSRATNMALATVTVESTITANGTSEARATITARATSMVTSAVTAIGRSIASSTITATATCTVIGWASAIATSTARATDAAHATATASV